MHSPLISIIAAVSKNGVIGRGNKLPWHIPEDMRHFRDLTRGHAVIMGRNTFASIGKALPDRVNVVIAADTSFLPPAGCIVVSSFEKALEQARVHEHKEIFVIGGQMVYETAIHFADKLYLTLIHKEFSGDTFFPDYSEFRTVLSKREGSHEGISYTFFELAR